MARDENLPQKKRIPATVDTEPTVTTVAGVLDDAQLEAQQLNRGLDRRDIKKEAEEKDHDRSEKFKDHFELIAVVTVWLLFFIFVAFGLTWAWHLLAPKWGWLTKEQREAIQGLLTGGVIVGLIADHVKRRMS